MDAPSAGPLRRAVALWAEGVVVTRGDDRLGQLEVTISFGADAVVVSVHGDVDLVTAADLGAVLAAAVERGSPVVVDLAATHFMGVAGLRVLEIGAERLAACGRRLTIRSPSVLVSLMLAITGLVDIVNVEGADEGRGRLGPEQTVAVPGTPAPTDARGLNGHLRRVAAVPAGDDVVDGALGLVVALARATVGGADGVSVSLHRNGQLTSVAASDQTILDMDAYQYASGEGPCVDASVEGRWFHAEALDHESRWPAFTPKARTLGINAILSSPLVAKDRPVGALNIYSRTASAFTVRDQELASLFATEASRLLGDAGVGVTDDQLSERLTRALQTRQSIAQAQGVLMEREGIGPDEAYTLLRRFSRETNQPLRGRAADIAGSTRRPPSSVAPEQKEGPWLAR